MFANRSKEEEIFPLTTLEIAEVQKANVKLKHCFRCNAVLDKGLEVRLVDDTYVVCKDGKMTIPKPLQRCAVLWYHHYLQHPGHTQLEETMKATMYWKGMRTTIRSLTKSCRTCQVNKKWKLKYGHLPPKTIITVPLRALCVDLIGPYTLKGKNGTIMDFVALTMINPTTSRFKVVELPLVRRLKTITVNGKESSIVEEIFNKTSECIAWLVNKTWLSRYSRCRYIIYNNGSEFKLNFEYHCETYGIKRKPTRIKTPQANVILERLHQVLGQMLCTSKLDMAKTITPDDLDIFLDNVAWAICSIYHTVLKASPGAAIFGHGMLLDIPFIADWNKIGTGNIKPILTRHAKIASELTMITKLGKVLLTQEGILCKAESPYSKEPWTITTVHTNGTIRIQCRKQSERLNIRRVTPFVDE